MAINALQPTLGVQAVHPKHEAAGQSGRDARQDGGSGQPERDAQEPHDSPNGFLNSLGQLTGKTINVTA